MKRILLFVFALLMLSPLTACNSQPMQARVQGPQGNISTKTTENHKENKMKKTMTVKKTKSEKL